MFYDHDPAVQIYLQKLDIELNKIINEENGSFEQSLSSTQIWIYFSNKQLPDDDDDDDDVTTGRRGRHHATNDIINRNITLVSTTTKNNLFIKLCNALSEDNTVKQLYLINYFYFPIEPIYIKHLRDSIIHQSCALQFLHLGQLNINDICIQLLFPSSRSNNEKNDNDTDEDDEDNENRITTNDIVPFGPNLQEIYLPYNNITDIGVSYIDTYLTKSHEKIRVVMWHNPTSVRCLYVNDNYEVIKEYNTTTSTTTTTKEEEPTVPDEQQETEEEDQQKQQQQEVQQPDHEDDLEKEEQDEHGMDEGPEQIVNI